MGSLLAQGLCASRQAPRVGVIGPPSRPPHRIEWPSGIVQTLTNVAPNQILTITEHQADTTNAPSLAVTKPAAGPVQLTATSQTNLRSVFEASSDLAQWTKIAVRTNLTGSVDFTPAASSSPRRFYRVQMP